MDSPAAVRAEAPQRSAPGSPRTAWRRARRHVKLIFGGAILVVMLAGAGAAPGLAPHNPFVAAPAHRLWPPAWAPGGTSAYLLGTDQLGRDILSRLIYGARVSLIVGICSVAIALPVGTAAGLLAGFRGGRVDALLMRLVDTQLSIPFLLLAISIISVVGASTINTILVLALGGWPMYARVVRADTLSLRERDFIEAARAIGGSRVRVVARHMAPHVLGTVSVIGSFATAQMILLESSLSYLGLGVQPPVPSWGRMLSEGQSYVMLAWWLATFPGCAIALTVLAINFIGDWVRDHLSPQTRML